MLTPDAAEGGAGADPARGEEPARAQAGQQVRGLGGARPAQGRRPRRASSRTRAVLQGERGRRHQRGRRPARLGAHERAVAVRAAAGPAWASTRSCTTPAATGTCSASSRTCWAPTRWACATSWPSPATRPSSATIPDATAVYDVDSIGLIRIMDHLNHGCDLAGNLIGPALGDPHRLRRRPEQAGPARRRCAASRRRCKAGAEYIMTQPVYDPRTRRALPRAWSST